MIVPPAFLFAGVMMGSEVYVSLQEDNKQLVVHGELTLLEKLICALRGYNAAVMTEVATQDEQAEQEAPGDE